MAKNFEIQLKFTTGKTANKLISKLTALAKAQDRVAATQKKFNKHSAKAAQQVQILTQREQKHIVSMKKQQKQLKILNNRIIQQNLSIKALTGKIKLATVAQNRMRISTAGLQRFIGSIRNKILLFTFAFGGAIAAVKGFVKTSMEFEAVQVRLNAMFGSVERGTEAFNTFNQIAATTPFTLQDVVEGGAALKAFGADAEALMKPTADLAAFMGTTATEAASALGRAFAGGAGAADILRERGILQLIRDFKGIDDLTKLTLPEFRKAIEETLLDPASGIAGSTDKLAKTMVGLTSNLADSFTRMSAAIGDLINFRGIIKSLTGGFSDLAEFFKQMDETTFETTIRHLKQMNIDTKDLELIQANLNKHRMEEVGQIKTLSEAEKDLVALMQQRKDDTLAIRDMQVAMIKNKESEQDILDDIAAKEEEFLFFSNRNMINKSLEVMEEINLLEVKLKQINLLRDTLSKTDDQIDAAEIILQQSIDYETQLKKIEGLSKAILKENQDLMDLGEFFTFDPDKLIEQYKKVPNILQNIDELQFRDIFPSGNLLEDLVKKFGDDAAAVVEANEMTRLNDAFEASLKFDEMFQDQMVNGFAESMNQIISLQEKNLNARINNELKALKKTDKFRNASIEQRQTMEDDIRAKFSSEQKRIFKMQQAMQISQVIQQTATDISGIMTAALEASLFDASAVPRAKAISVAMGAFSAAQIGAIAGQQAPAFARGGSFVTGGEQFIRVGDNSGGRERVDITPLSSPDFGDAGGGSSINVNIMGNVIGTQEFVRDNLLPEIENTIRNNLA